MDLEELGSETFPYCCLYHFDGLELKETSIISLRGQALVSTHNVSPFAQNNPALSTHATQIFSD